jgi:LPXTG-site transpeptidase (sortase) family protein
MSETNFFGLSRGHYDPLANLSRPLKVPERPVERSSALPARQVHRGGRAMDMVDKQMATQLKPQPRTRPAPAVSKPTSPIIPIDDLLNDFIDNKPRVRKANETKKTRARLTHRLAARKQARAKSKAEKIAIKKATNVSDASKTAAVVSKTGDSDFATRALTAAADTTTVTTTTTTPISLAMNNSGEIAVENRLPRVSLELKINKRHLLAFLHTIIVLTILAISGYLAWDTWLTNKTVQNTFSNNPVAAVAINETAPLDADTTSISNQAWAAYAMPADQARYIYLPTINARARVLSVGINSKGKIDATKNVNDAAWYDGSAKPGQEGQVFINGHTAFTSAYKAAFDDLPKLQIGDQIIIERGDGKQIYYRVVNNETTSADKVDMKKILNVPDNATRGLTLMSCTGKFNYRTQASDTRVIIYAVQE